MLAMWLARKHTVAGLSEISEYFGLTEMIPHNGNAVYLLGFGNELPGPAKVTTRELADDSPADVDGDGDLDLVCGNLNQPNVRSAGWGAKAVVYSFNGNKIMTTSGGGALVSPSEEFADRVRYLATQARQPVVHYEHTDVGFNYRLSNLLAAVVRAQLARLGETIVEVPVSYCGRSVREGKKIRAIDALRAVATLWRYRRWTPSQVVVPGATMSAVASP